MLSYPVGTRLGICCIYFLSWSYCVAAEESLSRLAQSRGSRDNRGCVWGLGKQEEAAGGSGGIT